ncbi:hypothetical protein [Kitasatospora sp. NPDC101183]|uniref:hypothetical protein n=1 Tax=Kitasatospora sp. NPDC101183 TaxID=3364100 RepID=UPI00381A43E3
MDSQILNELVPVFTWIATGAATEVGRGAAESSASQIRRLMQRWRERGNAELPQEAQPEQAQQEVRNLILTALAEDQDGTLRADLDRFHLELSRRTTTIHVEKGVAFGGDNHGNITNNFA